jgi:Zn-dependent protease
MDWLVFLTILIISAILHEVAHGSIAYSLGDPTAKQEGRLTLNPLPHLDPVGSFLLPLFLFLIQSPVKIAWAKPVPINPYNLANPKLDMAKIAFAGPASNFFVAIFFGLLLRFFSLPDEILLIFSIIVFVNILLAVFNLVPLAPLDGSKILFAFLPSRLDYVKIYLEDFSLFLILIFLILVSQGFIPLFPLIENIFKFLAGTNAWKVLGSAF